MIQICLDSVLICLDGRESLCRDKFVGVLLCAEASEDPDLEPDAEGAGESVDCERGLVCRSRLCFDVSALLSVCSMVRTFSVCLVREMLNGAETAFISPKSDKWCVFDFSRFSL
jgi:hypothetical protein